MKRVLVSIFSILIVVMISTVVYSKPVTTTAKPATVSAESQEIPQLKFDNKIFRLKFSAYSKMTKSYLNEYYRLKENGDNWIGLIGVQYLKSCGSSLDYATQLAGLAYSQTKISGEVIYNETTEVALVHFVLFG